MLPAFALAAALFAQKIDNVPPRIGYVFPPGGRAGTAVDVMIGGYDWTPDMDVFVHDPSVKIELAGQLGDFQITPPPYWFGGKASEQQPPVGREIAARITVPQDWPPGVPVRFQVANANGGSPPIDFVVSDAAEIVEPESNGAPVELPALPAVASGRLSRITEVGTFHFTSDRAGLTICRLDDQLGQPFCATLVIRDAAGRTVADVADTVGRGATARFVAEAGQKYTATVAHVDHAGDRGFVYRLAVRQGPDVVAVLPAIVADSQPTQVEVVGWGVKTGVNELESVTQTIDPSKCRLVGRSDVIGSQRACLTFGTPAGLATAIVPVSSAADALEPIGNEPSARLLSIPARITGAFDHLDDRLQMPVERYRLAAKKGEVYRLRAVSVAGTEPIDPAVAVFAADGTEVVRNDDLLVGMLESGVDFRCLADGDYDIVVTDASGKGPSRALTYRLLVDDLADAFDFDINAPDFVNVPLGAQADLVVKAARLGAWADPIALRLEDLPEGVTLSAFTSPALAKNGAPLKAAAPLKPGQKPKPKPIGKSSQPADVKQPLVAAADAPAGSRLTTLVATATVDGRTVEHRYGPVLVTAKMKHRATVRSAVQDGGRIVHRGTTYPAEVYVDRYEGFTGPVALMTASTQSRQRRGVHGPIVEVPAGVDRAIYPVTMPEWLETSLTTRQNLIAVAEVADPRGRKRFVTGTMDGQIVMSIEGALMKITHEPQERIVRPGQEIEIPIKVSRTPKLQVPVRVEVVSQDVESRSFSTAALSLGVSQSDAVVKLTVPQDAGTYGLRRLVLRALAVQDGRYQAVSETVVPLFVMPAATIPPSRPSSP
jgi:hypothetical protein